MSFREGGNNICPQVYRGYSLNNFLYDHMSLKLNFFFTNNSFYNFQAATLPLKASRGTRWTGGFDFKNKFKKKKKKRRGGFF